MIECVSDIYKSLRQLLEALINLIRPTIVVRRVRRGQQFPHRHNHKLFMLLKNFLLRKNLQILQVHQKVPIEVRLALNRIRRPVLEQLVCAVYEVLQGQVTHFPLGDLELISRDEHKRSVLLGYFDRQAKVLGYIFENWAF